LINRVPGEPESVWVTELWRSQADIDASLKAAAASELMPAVLELLDRDAGERIDLQPVGGLGPLPAAKSTPATILNLDEVEDMAPRFGLNDSGEARFARTDLKARRTGISLQRLKPGARQTFGHHHHADEEIYVVISGSGRVALDDEIREIGRLDAIRVAPPTKRAFEAGPEGLELLAFGTHHAGDAAVLAGYWAPAATQG
jgi:mannose-6-phosphate isomerase-like protein (cupin superfamily)